MLGIGLSRSVKLNGIGLRPRLPNLEKHDLISNGDIYMTNIHTRNYSSQCLQLADSTAKVIESQEVLG